MRFTLLEDRVVATARGARPPALAQWAGRASRFATGRACAPSSGPAYRAVDFRWY